VISALHRAHTSLLPNAIKSHSNKEEGRNKAEKELAGADHFLIIEMLLLELTLIVSITSPDRICQ
jgi:hypothetical protein